VQHIVASGSRSPSTARLLESRLHLRHRIAAALPLATATLVASSAVSAQDVVAITRRASPAVVTLHAFNSTGREVSLGSGFFLPDGRIATNRHVVEGATRMRAKGLNDRELGTADYAEAVGRTADLAILPRIGAPPATLPLATRLPEAGEGVVVIGAPEGLSNTVSTGIVSAIRRVQGRTLVQISAPISHGSSGGPVLNMRGEVIGVSVSELSEGQNLNFAVPVTELTRLASGPRGRIALTGDLRFGSEGAGPGSRGATRSPDSPGIDTSSTTTSGRRSAASRSASAPSAASPTTANPGSPSRMWRIPSRTTAWSSTTRTLIGPVLMPGNLRRAARLPLARRA
jgi:S1-C subfamily serine protease